VVPTTDAAPAPGPERTGDRAIDVEAIVVTQPQGPRPGAFGSVWDSQIGQTRTPSVESTPFDIEDDDEPAIPEYLIAEQRRGSSPARTGGNRQGGRGGRGGGYNAAVERERYGRGGGGGGGINRYPDVSGRTGGANRGGRDQRRDDRPPAGSRPDRERTSAGRSDEPWSEVPPELEAMLRAQLATRGSSPGASGTPGQAPRSDSPIDEARATAPSARTSTRRAPAKAVAAPAEGAEPAAPKRRTSTRKPAARATAEAAGNGGAPAEGVETAAPKRRTSTRKPAAKSTAAAPESGTEGAEPAAPKRRASTRKKAAPSEA
jgi:hypothetical protein